MSSPIGANRPASAVTRTAPVESNAVGQAQWSSADGFDAMTPAFTSGEPHESAHDMDALKAAIRLGMAAVS